MNTFTDIIQHYTVTLRENSLLGNFRICFLVKFVLIESLTFVSKKKKLKNVKNIVILATMCKIRGVVTNTETVKLTVYAFICQT